MKYDDILTQLLIFLAALNSTIYAFFSKTDKQVIDRALLVGKISGAVMLSFFIIPAIMEYFNLSLKMTLLITVIFAYGLESILKASVKRVIKTIDKDGNDDDVNS